MATITTKLSNEVVREVKAAITANDDVGEAIANAVAVTFPNASTTFDPSTNEVVIDVDDGEAAEKLIRDGLMSDAPPMGFVG